MANDRGGQGQAADEVLSITAEAAAMDVRIHECPMRPLKASSVAGQAPADQVDTSGPRHDHDHLGHHDHHRPTDEGQLLPGVEQAGGSSEGATGSAGSGSQAQASGGPSDGKHGGGLRMDGMSSAGHQVALWMARTSMEKADPSLGRSSLVTASLRSLVQAGTGASSVPGQQPSDHGRSGGRRHRPTGGPDDTGSSTRGPSTWNRPTSSWSRRLARRFGGGRTSTSGPWSSMRKCETEVTLYSMNADEVHRNHHHPLQLQAEGGGRTRMAEAMNDSRSNVGNIEQTKQQPFRLRGPPEEAPPATSSKWGHLKVGRAQLEFQSASSLALFKRPRSSYRSVEASEDDLRIEEPPHLPRPDDEETEEATSSSRLQPPSGTQTPASGGPIPLDNDLQGLQPSNRFRAATANSVTCSRCASALSVYTSRANSRAPSQMSLAASRKMSSSKGLLLTLLGEVETCKICLGDWPTKDMFRLRSCQCTFCRECMMRYVALEVMEGAYEVSCPDSLCDKKGVLDVSEIEGLVGPELVEKHKRFRLNTEVALDSNRTWCPRAGCDTVCHICRTVHNSSSSLLTDSSRSKTQAKAQLPRQPSAVAVSCPSCEKEFCSKCSANWHPGLTCQANGAALVQRSKDKDKDQLPAKGAFQVVDGEVIKQCPVCRVPIERDAGCAQMMCKRCKHVFCWFCLASLDGDFLLRHYDSGQCKGLLGHSRASVIWHRVQVVGIFAGFGLLLLAASPLALLAVPMIICWNCSCCKVLHEVNDLVNSFDCPGLDEEADEYSDDKDEGISMGGEEGADANVAMVSEKIPHATKDPTST